jgi:DNA-directed RNA polymerase subunit beta'
MDNLLDFKALKISLASPEMIKAWSHGEVIKPETINYRTLKPEKDGLFSENIFGPTKDWECYCGKYKRIRYRGIICDKCGVEVTQSKVRRERMGHITLASPVAHVWFFKGAPSKLSLLLDISPRNLEAIIYFAQYLVLDVDEKERRKILTGLKDVLKEKKKELEEKIGRQIKEAEKEMEKELTEQKKKIKTKELKELALEEINLKTRQKLASLKDSLSIEQNRLEEVYKTIENLVTSIKPNSLLTEEEYLKLREYNADNAITVGMGAEALLKGLQKLDLDKMAAALRSEIQKSTGQKHIKATKQLRIVEGMRSADLKPEWMILTVIPVIPPDLRPMVQLSGGRFATSDLNDLYRRVINRNSRLKHLIDLGAPEIILRNEKRMLQEAVDALIDSTQRPTGRVIPIREELRSLSDMLRGKQGRFRQNLLGKRVDYSGRSVIVVGPTLKLNQCGLPKEMALEMFKPFVLHELITRGFAPNVKSAKHTLERRPGEVWDILEDITKDHPVLLNRAPTLHKLGFQAFFPVLIEGSAIQIHPCVCAGYNADFDGDQMAVHIPLSKAAQEEAKKLLMSSNNLLRPADGSPITIPNKEMALGCYYYTTLEKTDIPEEQLPIFADETEAIFAYQSKEIHLRQKIRVRINHNILTTTVGRILFNEVLPESLRFVNERVNLAMIKTLIAKSLNECSHEETVKLIDGLKDLGFEGSTLCGGMSVGLWDCIIIDEKKNIVEETEKQIALVDGNAKRGLITQEEKKRLTNQIWIETTEKIADLTWGKMSLDNPVRVSIDSGGTRASRDQLKQLSAMRGLSVDPLGKIVELPTKSNFREGLSIFEYVTSTRGSRKGLTDSALKTADAGYLTRRLVDVTHDVIIRMEDCGTKDGIEVLRNEEKRQTNFANRILGRIAAKTINEPKKRKIIVKEGQEIDETKIAKIVELGIEKVVIRSPLTCQAKYGLCSLCYGRDFGTRKKVEIGTPVGVIAAQSIGEPGTQLTMRVRHAGGIVGLDVTQGLPRVEELFEARTPKIISPLAEIPGKVEVSEGTEGFTIRIKSIGVKPVEIREYILPPTSALHVKDQQLISAGEQLVEGHLDIKEILAVRGLRGAQRYLINEIQAVYESQGIPINDKHFEVIVRKMSEKVRVETQGDTALLPGELIDKVRFENENARILAEGGEPATAQVVILGVTRASLYTESWLSAASFQETTNVLTDAGLQGKIDNLIGLKENVIIGRLIPVTPDRAMLEEM